jgi:peptidyl-prolyl cis-trans isomerase C
LRTGFIRHVLCVAIAMSALTARAGSEAIATVNGKAIPKAMIDVLVIDEGLQGKPQESEFRAYAKQQLIQREAMAQQAESLKLDKSAEYQKQLGGMQLAVRKQFEKAPKDQLDARIAFNAQGMKAQLFIEDFYKKNPLRDSAIRAEYKRIAQQRGGQEYKLRHIQLATEAEAKAVIGRLVAGSKFESLAAESTDLGSKDMGGDLGWLKADGFPEAFANAVRTLAKGGFSREPVKTEAGYHVILVEGSREIPFGSYESYKAEIGEGMQQQALNKAVQALIQKAKVQ